MKSDFIEAVRRMVERGNPPRLHLAIPSPIREDPQSMRRPETVRGLAVQPRLGEATWDISWEPVPGASGYEIQTNPDPSRLMRWFAKGRVPGGDTRLKLHSVGNRLWLRVRALGAAGAGPWSDPVLLRRAEGVVQEAA